MKMKEQLELAENQLHFIRLLRAYKKEYKTKQENVHSNYEYDTIEDAIKKFDCLLDLFINHLI